MAILTITEQLEEIQAAITAILTGGQSYRFQNRAYTRADLEALYRIQDRLKAQYNREQYGATRNHVRFDKPQ